MIVDIIVIAVLLISAIIAFARGFIREVLTIVGVLGGVVAAYSGGPFAAVYFKGWLGVEEGVEPARLFGVVPYDIVALALAYGSIFIIVVILLSIVSHMLAESVRSLGLGAVDRTFGVIFGLARGAVLLGLLYLPVHMFVDKDTKIAWFEGSRTHVYLEQVATAMADFLPESTKKKAEEEIGKMQEANSARQKLQEIDLLHGKDEAAKDESAPPPAEDGSSGYTDEFREKMDALFDENSRKANE